LTGVLYTTGISEALIKNLAAAAIIINVIRNQYPPAAMQEAILKRVNPAVLKDDLSFYLRVADWAN
jgi:hypothetical protein